jgi:hypothetical protein
MVHRKKLVTALAFTIIVTLVVAVSTESVRQYMLFSWQIDEGDQFVYDVSVTGYSRSGSITHTLTLALLNNTRVQVEIISLNNLTLFLSPSHFAETVIEHVKTNTTFANGTIIPITRYHAINTLASRCFLPRGAWSVLGSFYPNQVARPDNMTTPVESYYAYQYQQFFIIGFVTYTETAESGWFGYISLDTGVPVNMTSWAWSSTDTLEFSYVMTLTSVV